MGRGWRYWRARLYLWPVMNLPVGTLDRPIESFVSVCCILVGTAQIFGPAEQQSVANSLPAGFTWGWSIMLILGGGSTIIGVTHGHIRVERSGLMLLSGSALIYAICAVGFLGWNSAYTVALTTAFSAACALRAMMVGVQLATLQAMRRELIRIRNEKRHG